MSRRSKLWLALGGIGLVLLGVVLGFFLGRIGWFAHWPMMSAWGGYPGLPARPLEGHMMGVPGVFGLGWLFMALYWFAPVVVIVALIVVLIRREKPPVQ
jgi:hypothetical protein